MNDFWNQWPGVILGAEGDEDNTNGSSEETEGEEDEDNSGEESGDESTNDDKPSGKSAEDFAALQKALDASRRITKKQDRELARLRASKETKETEKDESVEEAKQRELAATQRAEKLAAGLLKRDIDTAIKEAARDLKFIDVEDALNGVDRSTIVHDQDDEDPTDIDIDIDTVKAAVKKLATSKPHFLNKGTDDGEATGSQFGGSRKSKKSSDEALRELYPSL
jgi:hypothetical protein